MKVELKLRGIRSVQPSEEVRKIDHELMIYRKYVQNGKGGLKEIVSPISPSSFKGALRQAACLVALSNPQLREAYLNLFGSDVGGRCPISETSHREGKLIIELVGVSVDDMTLDQQVLKRIVEVRPRIRIDPVLGSVAKEALVFSEAVSTEIKVVFELHSKDGLKSEEVSLLESALRLLRGWGIGGWTSVGFGIIEEVVLRWRE